MKHTTMSPMKGEKEKKHTHTHTHTHTTELEFEPSINQELRGNKDIFWASLVAQLVKNPPAMWETWI